MPPVATAGASLCGLGSIVIRTHTAILDLCLPYSAPVHLIDLRISANHLRELWSQMS